MRETFKNAVIQNIGKIIAGLIVTTLFGVFTTIVIEPVKQVVNMPGEVREAMQGLNQKQQKVESRQMMLFNTLEKQTQTDSAIYKQLEKLNKSNDLLHTEMAVVKTKIATIRDEIPALHQRFNDIENTVKNAQSLSDIAYQSSFNNTYNE
jgi:predicted  nucleic acid-binding Zn-ribbon protein